MISSSHDYRVEELTRHLLVFSHVLWFLVQFHCQRRVLELEWGFELVVVRVHG